MVVHKTKPSCLQNVASSAIVIRRTLAFNPLLANLSCLTVPRLSYRHKFQNPLIIGATCMGGPHLAITESTEITAACTIKIAFPFQPGLPARPSCHEPPSPTTTTHLPTYLQLIHCLWQSAKAQGHTWKELKLCALRQVAMVAASCTQPAPVLILSWSVVVVVRVACISSLPTKFRGSKA